MLVCYIVSSECVPWTKFIWSSCLYNVITDKPLMDMDVWHMRLRSGVGS